MHTLPPLPYAMDALSPFLSKETLEYHYGKHHQTYVTNLNNLIKNTPHEQQTLEEIILSANGGIFNNAAQVWNHTFYWNGLSPNSSKQPAGALLQAITEQFGSFDEFKKQFHQSALTLFGSGWTWLVQDQTGKLAIVNTGNAENPLKNKQRPLLTCDVWEHAYYIDYRNKRADYLEQFWNWINWDEAARLFK